MSVFHGLEPLNAQIAQELGLNPEDVQRMTEQLRDGIVARQLNRSWSGDVECDEVYVVAGHKGHPDAVKKRPPGPASAGWFKETIDCSQEHSGEDRCIIHSTFDRSQVGTASGLPVRAVLS